MYDCICICPRIFKTISAPGFLIGISCQNQETHYHSQEYTWSISFRTILQVNPGIDSQPGIPLRIFFELLFAPVAAEIIFLVLVRDREFCILFINYHQTDGIGTHDSSLDTTHYRHLFLK